MTDGHYDGFTGFDLVGFSIAGDATCAVQTGDQRVAAGCVGADLLVFIK